MPVYAKKISTNDPRFRGRATTIYSTDDNEEFFAVLRGEKQASAQSVQVIPVPNNVVLCNGCNSNIAETERKEGYLVYLEKRKLDKDQPYDFYCESCVKKYFPKAITV